MIKQDRPLMVLTLLEAHNLGMTPLEAQRHWEAQGYKVHFRLYGDKYHRPHQKVDVK